MSSTVYDVSSYLANLLGQQGNVQNQITSTQQQIANLQNQYQSQYTAFHSNPTFFTDPLHARNDVLALDSNLQAQYFAGDAALTSIQSQIVGLQSKLSDLQTQNTQLVPQITAAQTVISQTVPRTTPTISSPAINLSSLKLPNLSNISPVLLIGGAALLILILK